MFRGLAGVGAHSRMHMARLADLAPDLPVVVEWIDTPERIDRLMPRIVSLVESGTITIDDVTIVKHTRREDQSSH
jgi:PII-like signaling protein